MKKVLKYVLLGWLVATIIGVAFGWRYIRMVATYNPIILGARYSSPETAEEARLQDLRYLRKLTNYDRSFSAQARADFQSLIDATELKAATISDAEFYLAVSQAVAVANNGHTNVSHWPLYQEFNRVGAKLYWFSDGLFVVHATEGLAQLLGSRVIGIEGRSIDKVVTVLSGYIGGNPVWKRLWVPMMIESPDILHAAGLSTSSTEIRLSLQDPGGLLHNAVLHGKLLENAVERDAPAAWMTLKPDSVPDEPDNWVRALDARRGKIPLYLTQTGGPLVSPLESGGLYIRTQSGFGTKEQPVKDFLAGAIADYEDGELDYLVVDYRLNSGGDYLKSIDFAKAAPLKLKANGKLYIVVGPQTFSAAIVTVAMLKYYGGDKALIVGSPMGDNEQFWAERGMPFDLPNSGWRINYATGYHDWAKGCADHPYCFTFNLMHQVPAGSLTPNVVLEPTLADYAAGRDVVLEWIRSNHGHSQEPGSAAVL